MQTRYLPLIFWLGNLFAKLFNYIVSTAVGVRMGVAGSYSRTLHIHVQPQKKRGNWGVCPWGSHGYKVTEHAKI